MSTRYLASKTRSQGRAGWSVTFRHPAVVNVETGKPGKRLRYGLSTREEGVADQLVSDLNQLLGDERWWNLAARTAAADRFDQRVVQIFYSPLDPVATDTRELRDQLLPLPHREAGYRKVLLVGTTGAGKTTVLRQLLGTDPDEERFPTTATGRTTIADMEVVLGEGDFQAVATFFPLDEIVQHLEDCVLTAILASHRGDPRSEVRRALLRHKDERFRFNYILGDGETAGESPGPVASALLAATSFGSAGPQANGTMPELGELALAETNAVIEQLLDQVSELARTGAKQIEQELGASSEEDLRVLEELLEEALDERLRDDDVVHELIDELVDEIRRRFDLVDVGDLKRNHQGWPISWEWSTDNRTAFIRQLRRFTSNAKLGFGRLLTPLVDGIRVRGPFSPTWRDGPIPTLTVFDTEGLGHTPDSSSSISTKLTRLIAEVDAVALVDNAEQPMQAAPAALLRALARSGHGAKLHICFTHFDLVGGENMLTPADRAMHVVKSCDAVLSKIGTDLGLFAERPLRSRVRLGAYYLADCKRRLVLDHDGLTVGEFRRLLDDLLSSGDRPTLGETRPIYDRTNLVVAVRDALEGFHRRWAAVLGRATSPEVQKEHWGRVKALSRRFAVMNKDEYLWLQPVADLQAWLQDQVWLLIQAPVGWTAGEPSDDEKQALFDDLANRLSDRMLQLAHDRLFDERNRDWQDAYMRSGPGSTVDRARIIADRIYAAAAPIPQATPAPHQNEFLHQIIEIVRSTAAELDIELK
jgi:hypothetical protein